METQSCMTHTAELPIPYLIINCKSLHHAGESHECHSKQTGGNQGNRSALHSFRYFHEAHLFAQSGKKHQCQTETDGRRKRVHNTCQQVVVFLNHQDSHTKNTTVGCNQRQEHTQRLIQSRRYFFRMISTICTNPAMTRMNVIVCKYPSPKTSNTNF